MTVEKIDRRYEKDEIFCSERDEIREVMNEKEIITLNIDGIRVKINLSDIEIKEEYEDDIEETMTKMDIIKEFGTEALDLNRWQKVIFDFEDQTSLNRFEDNGWEKL